MLLSFDSRKIFLIEIPSSLNRPLSLLSCAVCLLSAAQFFFTTHSQESFNFNTGKEFDKRKEIKNEMGVKSKFLLLCRQILCNKNE